MAVAAVAGWGGLDVGLVLQPPAGPRHLHVAASTGKTRRWAADVVEVAVEWWFILTAAKCAWVKMRGDNVLAKVCQCASGMNLHEMRLSRVFVGQCGCNLGKGGGIVRYPQGKTPRETLCIHNDSTASQSTWLGGGHVVLLKQPAAPLQHESQMTSPLKTTVWYLVKALPRSLAPVPWWRSERHLLLHSCFFISNGHLTRRLGDRVSPTIYIIRPNLTLPVEQLVSSLA